MSQSSCRLHKCIVRIKSTMGIVKLLEDFLGEKVLWPRCTSRLNYVAGNEPCLDLGVLKMIKFMLILGQVRFRKGLLCQAGLRKGLG